MAFKNPAQLEKMLRAMNHESFYFFIHVDAKFDIAPFLYLEQLERVSFIKDRRICNWGGYSFVKAIFASLAEVLNSAISFDFYNLMSAQDYPIKPIQHIANFYEENKGKSFISYDPDSKKDWWAHAVVRYETFHFTDLTFKGRYLLQKAINLILPKRTFPLPIKLYGSCISSWWSISKECADYLIEFMKINTELERFMSYTWAADEFLIATILMNSPYKDQIVNDNLRYITWSKTSPNPLILKTHDLHAILNSDKLFARKFDIEVDENILIKIDKQFGV
ncbi:MAG: beta-1,6-N-acetylglucosaminyltransferase [Bacteroidota bacterium]